jgi:hypothetical protein
MLLAELAEGIKAKLVHTANVSATHSVHSTVVTESGSLESHACI